jgi:hypothetical protein
MKRIRKEVALASGVGSLTLGDLRSCLPLTTPELRVIKLSAWGTDEETLSCVFPVGSATNVHPGDNAVWTDNGTPGNQRAQIHLTPAFDYRNFWFLSTADSTIVLATFGSSVTASEHIIVDVTVQYRTAVQTCPALEHLQQIRALEAQSELELAFELVGEDTVE